MNERLVGCIRDQAEEHFNQFEEVSATLRYFDVYPQELARRVEELNAVVGGINGLLTASPSKTFVNLEALRKAISPSTSIPTLGEVSQDLVEPTFVGMKKRIASGDFNLPQAPEQPGRPASILLMEGSGLLLEMHFQKPGLGGIFVLACEEILAINLPESRLFEDVLDWMLENKEKFSSGVQEKLREYE